MLRSAGRRAFSKGTTEYGQPLSRVPWIARTIGSPARRPGNLSNTADGRYYRNPSSVSLVVTTSTVIEQRHEETDTRAGAGAGQAA